jgi:hypothetical protein
MGSPRLDVVFCFWQCDKQNHGWREGPPVTVLCQVFDPLAGPSPSGKSVSNEKKNTALRCRPPAPHSEHWPVIADDASLPRLRRLHDLVHTKRSVSSTSEDT